MKADFDDQLAGIGALQDPVRRRLYRFVAGSRESVSREQAAAGVGVQKALAAFHLDKLADEGLLATEFRRLTGRSGPGAGRPAKLYRRSTREIAIALPPREYDVAGRLLAEAVEAADTSGESVRAELQRGAVAFGRSLGEEVNARLGRRATKAQQRRALVEVLADHGYEPHDDGRDLDLANCPFHALSQQFTALVCGMNLHVMQGLRTALRVRENDLQPRLEPEPEQCCVKFCTTP